MAACKSSHSSVTIFKDKAPTVEVSEGYVHMQVPALDNHAHRLIGTPGGIWYLQERGHRGAFFSAGLGVVVSA